MAKGASQADLDRHIVSSEPAATRVAETARLVALVLLRDDARVRDLYAAWKALLGADDLPHRKRLMTALYATYAAWSPTPAGVLRDPAAESLPAELHGLHLLTQAIGLGHYRWLPLELWFAFVAEALGEPVVRFTCPSGLLWASAGKSPKRAGPKGYRLEDLERNVTWWHRNTVAVPRATTYAIADAAGCTEPNVRQAVKRVRTLLACIDAPLPATPL